MSENSFEEEERGQEQEEKEIEKHSPRRPLKKTSLRDSFEEATSLGGLGEAHLDYLENENK